MHSSNKQEHFGLHYVNECPHKDRTNLTVPKSSIKCNYNLVEKQRELLDCSVEARNLLAKRPQSHHKYHMVIDLAYPHFPTQWISWK